MLQVEVVIAETYFNVNGRLSGSDGLVRHHSIHEFLVGDVVTYIETNITTITSYIDAVKLNINFVLESINFISDEEGSLRDRVLMIRASSFSFTEQVSIEGSSLLVIRDCFCVIFIVKL